ncbi:hypothetical protein QBC39DRAFT_175326 [Podospora conica]|nr:hypothetical protein QBC39DRAFT_175326 [Schizothecium conicum]
MTFSPMHPVRPPCTTGTAAAKSNPPPVDLVGNLLFGGPFDSVDVGEDHHLDHFSIMDTENVSILDDDDHPRGHRPHDTWRPFAMAADLDDRRDRRDHFLLGVPTPRDDNYTLDTDDIPVFSFSWSSGNAFLDPSLVHLVQGVPSQVFGHNGHSEPDSHVQPPPRTANMDSLGLALSESRAIPNPLLDDENPFEQRTKFVPERSNGAMITLAELAGTAAADLLLLASAVEAMCNLCCGLQGSDEIRAFLSKAIPSTRSCSLRHRSTGSCPNLAWSSPNQVWQLLHPLGMAV